MWKIKFREKTKFKEFHKNAEGKIIGIGDKINVHFDLFKGCAWRVLNDPGRKYLIYLDVFTIY